ncbi:hypothetical protein [Paracoccus aminovorans]|nr:hypothetical protein [Paracoccus aminovorans]MDQ7774417.1 hypothetical protein [Paracoccus aminovorans]
MRGMTGEGKVTVDPGAVLTVCTEEQRFSYGPDGVSREEID